MANRFWVGGTATWDATAGTKWATTSGGVGGAAAPTAADDVFFDANSGVGTITLGASGNCRSLDCNGYTGTFTIGATFTLSIGTSTPCPSNIALRLVSGMTFNKGGNAAYLDFNFVSTSNTQQTVYTSGKGMGKVQFSGIGGSWILGDSFSAIASSCGILLQGGTLDLNNQTVTVNQLFGNPTSNAITLNLTGSSISVTGTFSLSNPTNLTLNAGTSTIIKSGDNTAFDGGGLTYASVTIIGNNITIFGSNTISMLHCAAGKTLEFSHRDTQTVGVLDINGSSLAKTLLRSDSAGIQWRINKLSAILVADYVDIQDGHAIGSAEGGYSAATTTFGLETLSGSAVSLVLGDDEGSAAIALPFAFQFYGVAQSNIYVSSNGYVRFDSANLTNYSPVLPDASGIYADAQDLYPPGGGTIQYDTIGSAGSRIFVVDFTNIQNTSDVTALNSFQIKLFEADNHIEVHVLKASTSAYTFTQGVTDGSSYTVLNRNRNGGSTVADLSNDAVSFVYNTPGPNTTIYYAGMNSTDSGNNTNWLFGPLPTPTLSKTYLYKVYNNGAYLGLLPHVTSEFTYAQDINTAGAQIQIVVAETADTSAQQSPGSITDESGNPITDESGNNLLVEGATNIVGVGADSTLIKNGNKVVVYEFSQYYPNGKVMFSGEMERWEADFGGDNGEDTITILANSDGQDLDNYILQGSPYVSDQSQTTQNASALINYNSKSGAVTGVGQTFTTASGVTNVAAIDVMLSGSSSQVRVSLYASVSAANSGASPLATVTQAVSLASPTVTKFAFSSPAAVTASTQYFYTVTELAGGTVNVYYKNSNVYSGGDMYRQNYGGGGGDTLFHLTPFSDISTLSDLYFTTYSSAGATTAAFSGVDPSTGMVEPVIDQYRAQGGQINYAAGSIDATGTTVSYTFNTATVFEGIKEALALAPSGYYFYVDVGSDTLFFKDTSATADFVLTKGKHLSAVKIVATIENVKNELYFSGGLVSGSNLFRLYSNSDSITKYGPRLDRQSDNRVTTSGTANAIGNSFIAANEAEQYQTVVTVLDTTMDITLLKPGKVIGFNGFGTFIDNLLMQIVRIEYHPDYVTLTLGVLPPRLNPGFEKLNRELLALQTVSNPSSPS